MPGHRPVDPADARPLGLQNPQETIHRPVYTLRCAPSQKDHVPPLPEGIVNRAHLISPPPGIILVRPRVKIHPRCRTTALLNTFPPATMCAASQSLSPISDAGRTSAPLPRAVQSPGRFSLRPHPPAARSAPLSTDPSPGRDPSASESPYSGSQYRTTPAAVSGRCGLLFPAIVPPHVKALCELKQFEWVTGLQLPSPPPQRSLSPLLECQTSPRQPRRRSSALHRTGPCPPLAAGAHPRGHRPAES